MAEDLFNEIKKTPKPSPVSYEFKVNFCVILMICECNREHIVVFVSKCYFLSSCFYFRSYQVTT